jgi:hypothetical protein
VRPKIRVAGTKGQHPARTIKSEAAPIRGGICVRRMLFGQSRNKTATRQVRLMLIGFVVMIAAESFATGAPDALEEWIRAAQATNESQYTRGAIDATADMTSGYLVRHVDISMIWDGPATFWDFTLTDRRFKMRRPGEREWLISPPKQFRALQCGVELWEYDVAASALSHFKDGTRTAMVEIQIRPGQCWFRPFNSRGRRWADLVDRNIFPAPDYCWTVETRADGNIALNREHSPSGSTSETVWAPELGGNVISCRMQHGTFSETEDLEWAQHRDGIWYVKSLVYEQKKANGEVRRRDEITTIAFNPNPVIAPGTFGLQSLEVPKTAFVVEHDGRGGQRRYREARPPDSQRIPFDELVDWARSRGFSRPDRKP